MQQKNYTFQNINYTVKPFNAADGVVIFHILKPSISAPALDLAAMFGWVERKLVELTARNNENTHLLDTFRKYILSTYQLR